MSTIRTAIISIVTFGAIASSALAQDLQPTLDVPTYGELQLPPPMPPEPLPSPLQVLEGGGFPTGYNSQMPEGPTIPLTPDFGINIDPFEPSVGVQYDF